MSYYSGPMWYICLFQTIMLICIERHIKISQTHIQFQIIDQVDEWKNSCPFVHSLLVSFHQSWDDEEEQFSEDKKFLRMQTIESNERPTLRNNLSE